MIIDPTEELIISQTEQKEDPLHQQSEAVKRAVRRVRYNENKKRKVLVSIINKIKKKIDSQRKTITRLIKKLQEHQPKNKKDTIRKLSPLYMQKGPTWFAKKVHEFYNDDLNSTVCAGKKEFITKNKIKMQKRYLNAPLKILYRKFLSEVNIKISYSHFCKLRPFWIVFPKPNNRDTCLCSRHINMELLIKGLHNAHVLYIKCTEELLSKLCCDSKNEACLTRSCNTCSTNHLEYDNVTDDYMFFYEWEKHTKDIVLKNGAKKKRITTQKVKKTMSIIRAIEKLETDVLPFFNHVYKIVTQYKSIKTLKLNLTLQEACVHVDFSENYSLKFAAEVQSFHFGASRQQISLHTSVAYTHNFSTGSITPISVCTISDCLRHDASAIWAHLVPLVQHILHVNPFIDTLHFLSDSPSSQYRNKYMFFIISQIRQDFPQITRITWNYSEAGHGKGAPDGVGAVLKRTADRMVVFGADIGTYCQFYELLLRSVENVTIKKVEECDIIAKEKLVPKNLKPFMGTLSVYQVLWDVKVPQTILRKMSCFDCNAHEKCIHGYDIGRIPNNNLEHIENIDPPYFIVPLSKSNQKLPRRNIDKAKINILSDITIKEAHNVLDPFKNPKPSTSKI